MIPYTGVNVILLISILKCYKILESYCIVDGGVMFQGPIRFYVIGAFNFIYAYLLVIKINYFNKELVYSKNWC